MLGQRRPEIYVFDKGRLVTKEMHCQTQNSSIIQYSHTVRPTPDEYHIEAIKQYKKELDEMRKNYYQLQKAYYCLLGYKWDDCQSSLTFTNFKGKDGLKMTCVSEMSECRSTQMKKSDTEMKEKVDDMISSVEKPKKSQSKMKLSIGNMSLKGCQMDQKVSKTARNYLETKKQTDEQLYIQLLNAFHEIKDLKFVVEQTNITCQKQIEDFKYSYEQHIRKLEEILERERKHSKMLNQVIGRLRIQLSCKDNLIKSIMGEKFQDDSTIEKFVNRIQITS